MYFSQIQTSKHCLYKYSLAEFPLSPSKSTVAKMWPLKEMNWNNTKFIQQSSIKGQTFYIKFCHLCSLELIEIKAHNALETWVSWIMCLLSCHDEIWLSIQHNFTHKFLHINRREGFSWKNLYISDIEYFMFFF